MNILITGADGMTGSALSKKLVSRGHQVRKLIRKTPVHEDEFLWNIDDDFVDNDVFHNLDIIVHLAGAPISKRWTSAYKKEILKSRTESAALLLRKAKARGCHLKAFVSASGINCYGTFTSGKILTENDGILHQDFLSEVCREWEYAASQFAEISDRTVCIRTSTVLSSQGGALDPLRKLAHWHLASGIGKGTQWMNWIHLKDLCGIYIQAIENPDFSGAYNAVADGAVTNRDFMKSLAKHLHRNFLPVNVPSFVIKMLLGEMSEILLEGTRASNEKIKSTGFRFRFSHLEEAFADLMPNET